MFDSRRLRILFFIFNIFDALLNALQHLSVQSMARLRHEPYPPISFISWLL